MLVTSVAAATVSTFCANVGETKTLEMTIDKKHSDSNDFRKIFIETPV